MTTLTPTTIALSCTLLATLQQVSSHCLQQEQIPSICMHDVAQSLVLACTIAALPCPLDALMVPPFLQQSPIPFLATALMEFCCLPSEHQSYGASSYNVVNNNVSNGKSGPCCTAAHFTYSSYSSFESTCSSESLRQSEQ